MFKVTLLLSICIPTLSSCVSAVCECQRPGGLTTTTTKSVCLKGEFREECEANSRNLEMSGGSCIFYTE